MDQTLPSQETPASIVPNRMNSSNEQYDELFEKLETEITGDECMEADQVPFNPLDTRSRSTRKGYSAGRKAFNTFAAIQNNGTKQLEAFTKDDLTNNDGRLVIKAFQEYATFLIEYKSLKGKHFAPDTQTQYLSNAKNYLLQKFPGSEILRENTTKAEWYTELYDGLRARGRVCAIKRGEPLKNRTKGIRRGLLKKICKQLVLKGDAKSYQARAVILCLYHAVGRGGEVSFLNFNSLTWDKEDLCLWTGWNETKTAKGSDISFFPDKDDYLVDVYHALACHIITAGHSLESKVDPSEGASWLFPEYANLKEGGAATKAAKFIKQLVGVIDELCLDDHTSHSLRAGAADDLALNELVDVISIIARGNWDWTGECQMFGYVFHRLHVSRSGKALAHWHPRHGKIFPPSLGDVEDDDDRTCALELAQELFFYSPNALAGPALIDFRNTMVASLLGNLQAMEADIPDASNNKVLNLMSDACTEMTNSEKFGTVSKRRLRKWGVQINDSYKLRNAPDTEDSLSSRLLHDLTTEIISLKESHSRLEKKLAEESLAARERADKQDAMMSKMVQKAEETQRQSESSHQLMNELFRMLTRKREGEFRRDGELESAEDNISMSADGKPPAISSPLFTTKRVCKYAPNERNLAGGTQMVAPTPQLISPPTADSSVVASLASPVASLTGQHSIEHAAVARREVPNAKEIVHPQKKTISFFDKGPPTWTKGGQAAGSESVLECPVTELIQKVIEYGLVFTKSKPAAFGKGVDKSQKTRMKTVWIAAVSEEYCPLSYQKFVLSRQRPGPSEDGYRIWRDKVKTASRAIAGKMFTILKAKEGDLPKKKMFAVDAVTMTIGGAERIISAHKKYLKETVGK